ncbi:MAG: 1-deoxy-D-xylulose-5-phosphate synthase [Clostridia bacterium]|nr:1-deoxy-D-xylulose-5-phosphate synthase [Clostridia bacterium]
MLKDIRSPADIKALSENELSALAGEIREKIISTVSENGGHLASNLGSVELTLALHRVFDCPREKIIFDVGHQCYAHKLITGRFEQFETLRKYGGISGFTNRDESEYDAVTAGHSGSSVSAALGVASAEALKGSDAFTVAVVGDGSFTNGMIYEALNNCSAKKLRLVIVLNDNGMSISENVGALPKYLSRIRTSEGYFSFKVKTKRFFMKIPGIGRHLVSISRKMKNGIRRLLYRDNLFESLGLEYLGPVDGNDIEKLTSVLREAKHRAECTVVHIRTKKGLGYSFAEDDPGRFHSASPFERESGKGAGAGMSFTRAVSETLCTVAENDRRVVAVSAAMTEGVGFDGFADLYPDRYFDVGIAEEHAVAFCGGLSAAGLRPVLALYSTFAQRVYDQLFHDIVLQRVPMTLLLSHAGLVPGDGITHQGLFDVPLFSSIPNLRIFSPDSYSELALLMADCIASPNVDIIRYPKGKEAVYDRSAFTRNGDVFSFVPEKAEAVIVTYGRVTAEAYEAAKLSSHKVGVVRVSRLLPLPIDEILSALGGVPFVYILEEGMRRGGFCERLTAHFTERGYCPKVVIHAVNGEFVPHGDNASLAHRFGFEADEIAARLDRALEG